MKFRLPLAALLAISIGLASLGLGGWWWLQQRSPLGLQNQRLSPPAAAQFLPRSANLTVYLEISPAQLPAYGRAVAPSRQRAAASAGLSQLRDGLFQAAGLDYSTELSEWIGNDSAVALTAATEAQGAPGWVLALASRNPQGARQFLQRFWQARSLAGGDLDISSYRGLGLISSRGQATALVNDELVLLASSRGLLEQALASSQVDVLNQAHDPALENWLAQQPQGVALIRSDATGLTGLLGLPSDWLAAHKLGGLVGSLRLQGASLQLQTALASGAPGPGQPLGLAGQQLLNNLQLNPELLALGGGEYWLDPLINRTAGSKPGPLLPALRQAAATPLLVAALGDQGPWLAGTAPGSPAVEALDGPLAAAGFGAAELGELRVWSKLTGESDRQGQLQANLAGASGIGQGQRWWSNDLASLREQLAKKGSKPLRRQQLEAVNPEGKATQALALDGPHSRQLLQHWPLWRGLQLAAGRPLGPAVQGLALALTEEQDQVVINARLDFP
jgi:hypothetical protein